MKLKVRVPYLFWDNDVLKYHSVPLYKLLPHPQKMGAVLEKDPRKTKQLSETYVPVFCHPA